MPIELPKVSLSASVQKAYCVREMEVDAPATPPPFPDPTLYETSRKGDAQLIERVAQTFTTPKAYIVAAPYNKPQELPPNYF